MKQFIITALCIFLISLTSCQKDCIIILPLPPTGPPDSGLRINDVLPAEPSTICINSYQDLINAFGSNKIKIKSAELESGVIVTAGIDIHSITYEAINAPTPNSLFRSKISIEFQFVTDAWTTYTNEAASVGCAANVNPNGPVTANIYRGTTEIIINSRLTWGATLHQGEPIKRLTVQ